MGRNTKRDMSSNLEGLQKLMQEILRDCDQVKSQITSSRRNRNDKFPLKSLELEDYVELEKLNNDSLKLENQLIDKKNDVLKTYAKVLKDNKAEKEEPAENNDQSEKIDISKSLDKIKEMVKNQSNNKEYDLSDK